jgi:hypothetical protein
LAEKAKPQTTNFRQSGAGGRAATVRKKSAASIAAGGAIAALEPTCQA